MKKILLSLLLIVGLAASASAQKAELQFGYGGYTQMDATDMHDGWDGVNTAWGAVTFGVNFKINSKMWIGPSYSFSSCTTKGGPNHSKIAYHVIMLNGRYNYWQNSIVRLYAHLGLGVDISHMQPRHADSYNKAYCAFQISPLGAEVNIARRLNMFGELGFGAQGLVQVGLRVGL